MSKYIVFWKSNPGQQVTTVVDAHNQPVLRDVDYLEINDITVLDDTDQVFMVLRQAQGDKGGTYDRLVSCLREGAYCAQWSDRVP